MILLLSLIAAFIGCDLEPSPARTYPCTFGVYSRFKETVRIIDCEGLGSVYPGGIIVPTSGPAPTATFNFPRQKSFPARFLIRWKLGTESANSDSESQKFSQEVVFPKVEKGSEGMLRLELSEDNVWNLTFVKEEPKGSHAK